MFFPGHTLDDKVFQGPWQRVAGSPERLGRWRELGMLGMANPKRFEPARLDISSRKASEIGLKAELHSTGRVSPSGTEWSVPRTRGTSLASSVTSLSSPRSLEMTDSAVETMVKTIEDQEQEIQHCRKQMVKMLQESRKAEEEERRLREFIDRCNATIQETWTKYGGMQDRNNALKAKLDTLKELASIGGHSVQRRPST